MVKNGHSPQEIIARITQPRYNYLRDWIYGGIDGTVTTFSIISGIVGAHLSPLIVLILGLANLLGDGFSMAASNFLGTKVEEEQYKYYKDFEKRQTVFAPEGEKEEIRQIFIKKGFSGKLLDDIVNHIISHEELWIETMLQEEYGLAKGVRSPLIAALYTFVAFFTCGSVPLLPFLFKLPHAFLIASISTGGLFFLIGSIKSLWSIYSWWRSGAQILFIGVVAAVLAYLVGFLFHFYTFT